MDSDIIAVSAEKARSSNWWIAAGLFFVVLALYVLSSPGRIDIIDGQARFDVSYNWLTYGRPNVQDPWIGEIVAVTGRDGLRYSYYGAPASVFAMPLMWLAHFIDTPSHEASRFLFSLTCCFLGAGIALILFLFYLSFGVALRQAVVWTLVSSFSTLIWPASTSTFDNAQHAFFAIAATYFAFLSAKHNSKFLAAASGLLIAVLVLYQEYFLLLVPVLALPTLKWSSIKFASQDDGKQREGWPFRLMRPVYCKLRYNVELMRTGGPGSDDLRASCVRFLICIGMALTVGLGLTLAYNNLRFGSFLDNGKLRPELYHVRLFGNPVSGLATLIFSPGKSVFLYSPPILLCLIGMLRFRRIHRELAMMIMAASVVLISFISCILFVGGDWCWGPRYLTPLLPLWALTLPFSKGRIRRDVTLLIVGAGLLVQVLALSVENQRFFFERSLDAFFWAEDPWFYFKHSALVARLGETASLSAGLPSTARFFNSIPIPDWCTYTNLGPLPGLPQQLVPQWIRHFKIYYLPRPWPAWMPWIKPALRPINFQLWIYGLLGLLSIGFAFLWRGFQLDGRYTAAGGLQRAQSGYSTKMRAVVERQGD